MTPYEVAQGYVGRHERRDEAVLRDFLYNGGHNLSPTQRAWCADFVNASLGQSGMQGTGSGMARSFLKWGDAVQQPQAGDVAVFRRGSDPNAGHVGFYAGPGSQPGTVRVLGGNQSDAVGYSEYPTASLLGYRRASAATQPPTQQMAAGSPPAPVRTAALSPPPQQAETAPAATPVPAMPMQRRKPALAPPQQDEPEQQSAALQPPDMSWMRNVSPEMHAIATTGRPYQPPRVG